MPVEKKTQQMRFYGTEELELALRRLAEGDNRSFSDYLRVVLERHVWGHGPTDAENGTGLDQAD